MGNTVSTDCKESDKWWPTPHTNKEPITQPSESKENKYEMRMNENILPDCKANTKTDLNVNITQSDILQSENSPEVENDDAILRGRNDDQLQQFRSDLEKKHLARREAIAERSREILFLRNELSKYKIDNENLLMLLKEKKIKDTHGTDETKYITNEDRNQLDLLAKENAELLNQIQELKEDMKKSEELIKQNNALRIDISTAQKELQTVNAQMLEYEKERHEYKAHVIALKDVIHVSKTLLEIREGQLKELKAKITEIEASLAEHEASMLSSNLKNEYERQLRNMRALRTLYEQRQAATKAEKDLVASKLSDMKQVLDNEQRKNSELQERVDELENNVSEKFDKVNNLESQLGLAKAEYRDLDAEMSVINQLFSQILLTFNNDQGIDLDKLIRLLEENHDLLTNIIVNEESEAVSSVLPKVLLDLINRVNTENENSEIENSEVPELESDYDLLTSTIDMDNGQLPTIPEENLQPEHQCNNQINSAEDIVNKLPKVWRVLIELLRQQSGLQQVNITEEDEDPCYKSVETPKGPKLVLSVSKTFIRLKDLILEKKSLEKETMRLKQLNTHLEVRLQDQEKRLELVSSELSKTWHVVGRMQRQHQQLHTHEKILRYELAEKRKMLTELKDELEYCREKWEQAREKNSTTEVEWRKLRSEFASRKTTVADDLNNSAESGYSDERECSSDDDISFSLDDKNKSVLNNTTATKKDNSILSDSEDNDATLQENNNKEGNIDIKSGVQINELNDIATGIQPMQDISNDSKNIAAEIEEIDGNESVLSVPQNNMLEVECDESNTHSSTQQKTECSVQTEKHTTVPKCISLEEIDFDNISDTKTDDVPNTGNETTSSQSSSVTPDRTQDEMLARREARLQKMEEQCKQLVIKVTNNSNRGTEICTRLETLHEQYGNEETERK